MNGQGRKANKTGLNLETQIQLLLKSSGYQKLSKKDIKTTKEEKYFITQYYLCDGIYDTKIKTDFFLINKTKYPNGLAIETKWQQVSGSVDEKFPYLVLNIKNKYPCQAIIIIDGEGYKPGALTWLQSQLDNKLIGVCNLKNFIKFVNNDKL